MAEAACGAFSVPSDSMFASLAIGPERAKPVSSAGTGCWRRQGPAGGSGNAAVAVQIGKARADLAGGLMGDAGIHGRGGGKDIARELLIGVLCPGIRQAKNGVADGGAVRA